MTDTPTPPDGWYPDPAGGGGLRRWDGTSWTDEVRFVDGRTPTAARTSESQDAASIPTESDEAPVTRFDAAGEAEHGEPAESPAPASDTTAAYAPSGDGTDPIRDDIGARQDDGALTGDDTAPRGDADVSGDGTAPHDGAPSLTPSTPGAPAAPDEPSLADASAASGSSWGSGGHAGTATGSSDDFAHTAPDTTPEDHLSTPTSDSRAADASTAPAAAAGAAAVAAAAAASAPPASSTAAAVPPTPVAPAAPASSGAPAYPGTPSSRAFEGAPPYPHTGNAGGYPVAPTAAYGAASRRDVATNTVWVWLVVLLPLVSLVSLFAFDWGSYMRESVYAELYADPLAPAPVATTVLTAVSSILSIVLGAATVLFSFLDWRQLRARGIERPFHWAWSFFVLAIGSGLVYIIGRSVVVRRQTGKGLAPLWAAIAVTVVTWIAISIWVVMLLTQVFSLVQELQYTYGY